METEEFWKSADIQRLHAKYRADEMLASVTTLSREMLEDLFLGYLLFTQKYISDLSLLVSRLPDSDLRSVLGEILNEELGEGDASKAHSKIYENFLRSFGISEKKLKAYSHPENTALLNEVSRYTGERSVHFAAGVRGMVGECLCQVYLEVMHDNFIRNPVIVAEKSNIDWEFWRIHAGTIDQVHREKVRNAINKFVVSEPGGTDELKAGYAFGVEAWDRYWANTFRKMKNVGSPPAHAQA